MNGFERRKEQKRDNIRRAAMELFQVHGFNKVSLSDVASRAGVSQVTIYNHFGSKEGLVREIVKQQLNDMLEKYRGVIQEDKPFPEKMETIVFDKTQIASEYRGEFIRKAIAGDPELRQYLDSLWQKEINQMTLDFLEQGKEQGFVNPKTSQKALTLYLEIMRRGVFASPDLIVDLTPDIVLFRELNFLFIYGLVGKPE